MTVRGELKLEFDDPALEARVTITVREDGDELSPDAVLANLKKKGVRAPADTEAVERAFRSLGRRKDESITFVAASGTAPVDPEPEVVEFEDLPTPRRLAFVGPRILAQAAKPEGFRLREVKVRREKKVLKKPALPFLQPQEEVEVVVEKKLVREAVQIDPAVLATGFAAKDALVARIRPGKPGKDGRDVFGRLVAVSRAAQAEWLLCSGLTRAGAEVRATVTGFLRRGASWCDIVPFHDHELSVTAGPDGTACLLSFEPGDAVIPPPTGDEVLELAGKLGFAAEGLLSASQIEALLRKSVSSAVGIENRPLSQTTDGYATVTVSEDRLRATLSLQKGKGGGAPLTAGRVSDAIRESRVRRYNAETVRRDIQEFLKGPDTELSDYVLAEGKAPGASQEGGLKWSVTLRTLSADRKPSAGNRDLSEPMASLREFPLESVESVCAIAAETPVVRIAPGSVGSSGVDVFGAVIPGLRGETPVVRIFEGLELRRDTVFSTAEGLLEKGTAGAVILLRVRPHRDAELDVTISDDRMQGFLAFTPPLGTGRSIGAEEVRAAIGQAGIVRGVDETRLATALEAIARGQAVPKMRIAQGRKPALEPEKLVTFHVRLATGKAMALRSDGSADFRAQDRITHVAKGAHIATLKPPPPESSDAWDVTGRALFPTGDASRWLTAGRGVSAVRQPDGTLHFYAQADGEIIRDGSLIAVEQVHTVDDVDMATGNINFPGIVRVRGSVRAGFRVLAAGDVEIEETVEAAAVTSQRSILVGQGIKGDGKAAVRANKGIVAPFAEQALLRAAETIQLKGACLRCNVVCGKLILDSEKGNLVGGEVRARGGIVVQNLGSPAGTRTLVSFGQDFLAREEADHLLAEVSVLEKRLTEIDDRVKELQKSGKAGAAQDRMAIARIRVEKLHVVNGLEERRARLAELNLALEARIPSEIVVRGTFYPGAVIESHGKRWETLEEKHMITLAYDPKQDRIVVRL